MRGSRDCRVAGGSCPTSGWSRTGWRSTCTRFRATSSTATRTPPGTRAESSSRRSLKDDRNHDENELKLGRAGPGLYDRINVFSDYPALYGSRMNELMGLLVHQLKTQNENIPQVYVDHILLSTGRSVGRSVICYFANLFSDHTSFFHDCHLRCLAEYVYWPFAHALVVE